METTTKTIVTIANTTTGEEGGKARKRGGESQVRMRMRRCRGINPRMRGGVGVGVGVEGKSEFSVKEKTTSKHRAVRRHRKGVKRVWDASGYGNANGWFMT